MAVVFEPDKSGSASLIVGMGIKIEKKWVWDKYAKNGYGASTSIGMGITRPIPVPEIFCRLK